MLPSACLRKAARSRAVLAAAVALIACLAPATAAARVPGKLVPASGALMGAFVNPNNSYTLSTTDHENLVTQFETLVGRKLDRSGELKPGESKGMTQHGSSSAFWLYASKPVGGVDR